MDPVTPAGPRWANEWHGRTLHTVPIDDTRTHYLHGRARCWCAPTIHPATSTTRRYIVHNAHDGRELVERHGVN